MSTVSAYIGLGSNLEDPVKQVLMAIDLLNDLPDTQRESVSPLYQSKPLGPQDQPDYINAVARINTRLPVRTLLSALQQLERQQGRTRDGLRWGARIIDLDILLYGDLQITDKDLTIPHAGLLDRDFVLYPLNEIAPDLLIPGVGLIQAQLKQCPMSGLEIVERASEAEGA